MEFPQVIRHRKVEATIYGKSRHYQRYRLAFYVVGQRRLRTFANYSEAKAEAERNSRPNTPITAAPAKVAGFIDESRQASRGFRSSGRVACRIERILKLVEQASQFS